MAINNPALLASFDANQTNTQTPPPNQISDGYVANEIPLSEHHGFMFNEFYKYLNHLKETGISQWDSTVSYSQHSRIMRDGVIYKSTQDANQGNDPLSTSLWAVDQWRFQTTTHNITTDSDYTLTSAQNNYGRIVITDTGTILTAPRNIIVDDLQKYFIVVNETAHDLTFKTSSGVGVVIFAGEFKNLYNDGVDVITNSNESVKLNLSEQEIVKTSGSKIKNQIFAFVNTSSTAGDIGSSFGISGLIKNSVGNYTITLNTSVASQAANILLATINRGASNRIIDAQFSSTTTINVLTAEANGTATPIDERFSILVTGGVF